jgi:hypothetical protein
VVRRRAWAAEAAPSEPEPKPLALEVEVLALEVEVLAMPSLLPQPDLRA